MMSRTRRAGRAMGPAALWPAVGISAAQTKPVDGIFARIRGLVVVR